MGSLNFGVLPVGVNARDIQGPERRFGRVYNTDDTAGVGQKSNELLTFNQVVKSFEKVGCFDPAHKLNDRVAIVAFTDVDLSSKTTTVDINAVTEEILVKSAACVTVIFDLSSLTIVPSRMLLLCPRGSNKTVAVCGASEQLKQSLVEQLTELEVEPIDFYPSKDEALAALKVKS